MSRDEKVDGPSIAARILNSMSDERKQRLLQRIQGADPAIFRKIESNIITFDDIKDLTDQGVQRVIKETAHEDLVLSLKKASDEVISALLRNMSQRKREMVEDDVSHLPPIPANEVEAAQQRIVALMDRLRTEGVIHRRDDGEKWV